jgi:hypothetical protein
MWLSIGPCLHSCIAGFLVLRVVSDLVVWVRDNVACLLRRRWCFARVMGLVFAR